MPITRDNRYHYVRLPLVTASGEDIGTDFRICKACGSIVQDTKIHNEWHKNLGGK